MINILVNIGVLIGVILFIILINSRLRRWFFGRIFHKRKQEIVLPETSHTIQEYNHRPTELIQHFHFHFDSDSMPQRRVRITEEKPAQKQVLTKDNSWIDKPVRDFTGKLYIPLSQEQISKMMDNPDLIEQNPELEDKISEQER
jgi:hypothetical protein